MPFARDLLFEYNVAGRWGPLQAIRDQGIELIAQQTARACETYNEMRDERQVAAALHLTC